MDKLEFKIDNRSTVLEHLQIAQQIKVSIVNQTLLEGFIKTPKVFAKKYNLELGIVLDAFDVLLKERVLKIDSEGNYYNAYEQRLLFLEEGVSSIEFIKSIEMEPKVKVVSNEEIVINEKQMEKTNFPLGLEVIRQERIFFGDDIPIIYAIIYFKKEDEKLFDNLYISLKESLKAKYSKLSNHRNIYSIMMPNNINKILNQPEKMIGTLIEETIDSKGLRLYYGEFYYNRYYTIKIEF